MTTQAFVLVAALLLPPQMVNGVFHQEPIVGHQEFRTATDCKWAEMDLGTAVIKRYGKDNFRMRTRCMTREEWIRLTSQAV